VILNKRSKNKTWI